MPTILFNNYTGRRLTLQITGQQKPIYVNKNNWVQSKEGEIVVNLQARIFWFKKAKHSFTLNIKRTDRIVSIYMDPLLKLYLYPTQQYPLRTLGFLLLFSGLYHIISKLGNFQTSVGSISFRSIFLIIAGILFIFMVVIECLAFFRIKALGNVFEIPNPSPK